VTRQEMASFLARAAGLGTNPPVANAKTAQTATNATQLGGVAAANYVQRGAADFAVSNPPFVTGPLPKSTTFTSHGGKVLLSLSGSGYATSTARRE